MDKNVGRYALIKLIGSGGMAEVWTGKVYGSSGFEKVVAVKLLSKDKVDKEIYQQALTDEALIQVHLKHPNIVDILDLNIEGENPYMVMEYVEGLELRHLLLSLKEKKGLLPFSVAAFIVSECSKALSHAHQCRHPETGEPLQVIHRDVSPSNLLISARGEVKLSDFGIAKSTLQSSRTVVGQLKGKFRYMSPEQARGLELDYRSDIYALGLVFYEALFGEPAYEGNTDVTVLNKAQSGEIVLPAEIDVDLKIIFGKLLNKEREGRYQNLEDFRKDLRTYAAQKEGLADYDDLRIYLEGLDLPQIRKAVEAKREAEEWKLVTASQILDQTGQISIVGQKRVARAKWYWAAGLVAGALALTTFFVVKPTASSPISPGALSVETTPVEAIVDIRYGQTQLSRPSPISLKDLPLGIPIRVQVSQKGYETLTRNLELTEEKPAETLVLNLMEVKEIQATFTATPYAEVTVPGLFADVETPAVRKLPPGRYQVTFVYPPSGKQVLASLAGQEGGQFTCSADMAVEKEGASPSASCWKK